MSKTEPAAPALKSVMPKPGQPSGSDIAANSAETKAATPPAAGTATGKSPEASRAKEIGGPKGPEPTRYGDWERDGRCVDF